MNKVYRATLPDAEYWAGRIPCQIACPIHTDAGRYVQLIAEGRFEEAFLTAKAPNPLASICGRVCAAPCEDKCRRGLIDSPVSIRALKRFVTERYGVESRAPQTQDKLHLGATEPGNKWPWHLPHLGQQHPRATGERVAVIGAGPAGLACAHDLVLRGYQVTVFEASARPGGMAVHGIPEFRLPRGVIDKEFNAIADLGVEFRFNTRLTAEFGLAAIQAEGFQAVFIAIGLQQGRELNCPGSNLDGVVRAVDYLLNINNGYKMPQAKKVLVIGGGFTAFDAARMALRASAAADIPSTGEASSVLASALDAARLALRAGAEVTLASLESFAEMPVLRTEQGREEFEEALAEGVRFKPQRAVRRFTGEGKVERAEFAGVARTYDTDGKFAPVYEEKISEQLEADLVILAIGQQADLSFIKPQDGIELGRGGVIQVDHSTLATSAPGVFAGGDAAFGPRNLIEAVADGKLAAQSIEAYLSNRPSQPKFHFKFEKIPTRRFTRPEDYDRQPRQAPPTAGLGRRSGISEVESAYDEAQAQQQAERCLACHIQTIYDPELCVLCNRCVDVCPEHCLKLVPLEEVELPAEQLAAALELGGGKEAHQHSVMLKDDERCIRCGLCAIRCPTDAMTMEVMYYENI